MAYSSENSQSHDSEYDFVEQPPGTFFCSVSRAVLLEPYQTQCCGNHLSEETYQRLQGQACPVCKENNLTAMKDKFHKRNVLSLKVRCPHKAEGCEWEGGLGSLQEEHLNTNSSAGECRYVDVDCPYACGERVQRRNLEEHESLNCPLRPFTCQYCNHEATHQEVTKEHWPVCEKYPLPCPNECGEERIEQQNLKEHLEQTCPLEEIECEFSYAGCGAQLQRRLMPAHMKEGMEAHLSLAAQVSKKVPELEKIVRQQADQIKQQENQISELKTKAQLGNIPPIDIMMDVFEEHKKKSDYWFSPPFYSHLGGYKMCLEVDANGDGSGKGTHVSVAVHLMRGEFDDHLKWPFRGRVTVQLKKKEPPHYQRTINLDENTPDECLRKPTEEMNIQGRGTSRFISHDELYAGGYLKLLFCVCDVLTH